ncbi:3-oxoacyl-[acyl-carrier protein] reductase [Chryseobacterium arachidis]|uniref:3-oxoacyl-[acyl-carrier protein] reductase n=1 Tax=Chryseobacterium arachidis TaxID=1416778 RepID=A0A1M5JFR2_9FLAO|nr:SDR family oxidoreductase [Chryseobacterium arachidis]SHG39215.1 3-oxoacyl-[acyl-carrier protein] reductase [Chryseobacterium arachidis]
MSKLKNKTAFVTGGSRGIGEGIVRQLALEGANVIFTYVSSRQKAEDLVAEIEALGVKSMAIKADAGNPEEISSVIQQASDWGIDILVNNAGLFVTGEIDNKQNDLSALQKQWEVNVHGVVSTVRNVLPLMKNGGRIISIGSTGATRSPYPGIGDYAATKAALAAYTRSWARDLGSRNITVNIIQPGLINTDMNPSDGPFSAQMLQSVALGHYGEPKDIGMAVAFLASDEARYITGTTLNVDGGQTT